LIEVQASEQETKNLTRQIEEYQDYARRIHILGAEIDRLRAENKNFDEDIKRMRLKYSEGINNEKKE
jgi:predicted RNase H-like nuclease (RuvC/YqgF family)